MRATMVLVCICAIAGVRGHAETVTLTFEDVQVGQDLYRYYVTRYGIGFASPFQVANHSASTWGPPHSGSNVLINAEAVPLTGGTEINFQHYGRTIKSFAVYFSTQQDVVIKLTGSPYGGSLYEPVAMALVGGPGESWNNRYVELRSEIPIGDIHFWNVSSGDALFRYSADDITIEFVPEPSSLAFLSLALAGVGIGVARRRVS